jgi:hypothetical protein
MYVETSSKKKSQPTRRGPLVIVLLGREPLLPVRNYVDFVEVKFTRMTYWFDGKEKWLAYSLLI